jgi:predicted AlkP superfamily phosphohydrolase/phosphomutase
MKQLDNRPVLAIGIDAAEPSLVRTLIEQGRMPALKRLLDEGATWSVVESPAWLGSGAVWPTFMTGEDPNAHEVCSEWRWQPETMNVSRFRGGLIPFWKEMNRNGAIVGVLDVPFAQTIGFDKGFEICEWGAHDALDGRMTFSPATLSGIVNEVGLHPFSQIRPGADNFEDDATLRKLVEACIEGAKLRGKLATRLIQETRPEFCLIVFPEVHRAGHRLWHTVSPDDPLYANDGHKEASALSCSVLPDILQETDKQIERLIEATGSEATIFVFSLHGMRPARGVTTLLDPLLCHFNFAARSDGWDTQSWSARARSLFASMKRRAPAPLKRLYYRTASQEVTRRLAQTTMIPTYDWSRTRAFSLPTDQHGWIRLNVDGREVEGIVPQERYDETCCEIAGALRSLTTEDGKPVVRDVIQLSHRTDGSPPKHLPDLIVHWHDAAFCGSAQIKDLPIKSLPEGSGLTGQHAPDGFCIMKSAAGGQQIGERVAARDFHQLMISRLRKS